MLKLEIYPTTLHLKHTFKIAHDKRDFQKSVIIELTDGLTSGFGEATENKFYGVKAEDIIHNLKQIQSSISAFDALKPEEFHREITTLLKDNSFPICALDEAFLDFYGKKNNIKTYEYWGLKLHENLPLSNYTIGLSSIEEMVFKMKEINSPIYKIKLGTNEDVKIIKELRKHTNSLFRVDANCAWNTEETIHNSIVMKDLGVEFIEQPMHPEEVDGMKHVYSKSVLPIIADESCISENDVQKCDGLFHGLNIKLTKCGGPTVALRMIENAKKLGLKVMIGCMTESSVGISAIAQLLPLLDYVDMDGALLLDNDPACGVTIINGKANFRELYGNGVTLKKSLHSL